MICRYNVKPITNHSTCEAPYHVYWIGVACVHSSVTMDTTSVNKQTLHLKSEFHYHGNGFSKRHCTPYIWIVNLASLILASKCVTDYRGSELCGYLYVGHSTYVHYTPYTISSILYDVYCKRIIYVHCTMCIVDVHCTSYTVLGILFDVHRTTYFVHSSLYTVHLYTVHCTVYNVY